MNLLWTAFGSWTWSSSCSGSETATSATTWSTAFSSVSTSSILYSSAFCFLREKIKNKFSFQIVLNQIFCYVFGLFCGHNFTLKLNITFTDWYVRYLWNKMWTEINFLTDLILLVQVLELLNQNVDVVQIVQVVLVRHRQGRRQGDQQSNNCNLHFLGGKIGNVQINFSLEIQTKF